MRQRTPIQELRLSYRIAKRLRRLMWRDTFDRGWHRGSEKREETEALKSTMALSDAHIASMGAYLASRKVSLQQKTDAIGAMKLTIKEHERRQQLLQPERDRLDEMQEIFRFAIYLETGVRERCADELRWSFDNLPHGELEKTLEARTLRAARIDYAVSAGGSGDHGFCTSWSETIHVDFSGGRSLYGKQIRRDRLLKK